jgi:hypothetical protein
VDPQAARAGRLGIDLGDAHPLEDPERREAPLALQQPIEPERLALLHGQLATDHLFFRVLEAGHDHVVDVDARPRAHVQHDDGGGGVLAAGGLRHHLGVGIAAVAVGGQQVHAVARQVPHAVGDPRAQPQLAGDAARRQGHRRVDGHAPDRDPLALLHAEQHGQAAPAVRHLDLDLRFRVAAVLQRPHQGPRVGVGHAVLERRVRARQEEGPRGPSRGPPRRAPTRPP